MNTELRFAAAAPAGVLARPCSYVCSTNGNQAGRNWTMAHVDGGFTTKRITTGVLGGLT